MPRPPRRRRGFDLESGPLFRARLLRLEDEVHVILLTVHHAVCDGWSIGLIVGELAALYAAYSAGQPSPLPELSLQYGDFAVWQAEHLKTPSVAAQLDYWKRQLAALDPLALPPDRPPVPGARPRGRIDSILLPRELTDRLARNSHQSGATLFMTCLACLKVLLHLATSRHDVAVGTLVTGRLKTELEPLVGLFVNTLVLRTDFSGEPTFPELLSRVRRTVTEGMDNQDPPFSLVVEAASVRRQKGRQPLFGVNFLFQRDFLHVARAGEVTFTSFPSVSPGAMLDLNLFMVERDEGWRAACEYNPDEYNPDTVRSLLRDFQAILERVADHPDQRISALRPPPEATPRTGAAADAQRNGHPAAISGSADARGNAAGRGRVGIGSEQHTRRGGRPRSPPGRGVGRGVASRAGRPDGRLLRPGRALPVGRPPGRQDTGPVRPPALANDGV